MQLHPHPGFTQAPLSKSLVPNQYLFDIVINGHNNDYTKVLDWYEMLSNNSYYISKLIQQEQSKFKMDTQVSRTNAANGVEKVLYTISIGCLSKNTRVSKLCLEALRTIATDWTSNQFLRSVGCTWMLEPSPCGGCYILTEAIKNHETLY